MIRVYNMVKRCITETLRGVGMVDLFINQETIGQLRVTRLWWCVRIHLGMQLWTQIITDTFYKSKVRIECGRFIFAHPHVDHKTLWRTFLILRKIKCFFVIWKCYCMRTLNQIVQWVTLTTGWCDVFESIRHWMDGGCFLNIFSQSFWQMKSQKQATIA